MTNKYTMESKLVYVPKSDINNAIEFFNLLKKISLEDLHERCKKLSGSFEIFSLGMMTYDDYITNRDLTIKHNGGFISIGGVNLEKIIEAAWVIDTGRTFEDNQNMELRDIIKY